MTLLAIALAFALGFVGGYLARRYRLSLLAENNHWCGEEIEALKGADLDADVAAHRRERLSGEQPAVGDEPAQPRPTPVPLGERECNNCHKPAVFAWKTDGFPFAACNLCISLWFEDGLPDHVMRIGDEPPRDVYSFLDHPDELNAWCSAIHADDDTSSTGPRSVPGPRGRVSD